MPDIPLRGYKCTHTKQPHGSIAVNSKNTQFHLVWSGPINWMNYIPVSVLNNNIQQLGCETLCNAQCVHKEKFEGANGVIRSRNSKDRHYNGQRKKEKLLTVIYKAGLVVSASLETPIMLLLNGTNVIWYINCINKCTDLKHGNNLPTPHVFCAILLWNRTWFSWHSLQFHPTVSLKNPRSTTLEASTITFTPPMKSSQGRER